MTDAALDAPRVVKPRLLRAVQLHVAAHRVLGIALLLIIAIPTLLPLLWVIFSSFNNSQTGFVWSTAPWQRLFDSPKTISSIGYSFLLAIRVPIAIVVALVLAWLLVRVDIPGRRFLTYCLWFGFFLPVLPIALGWIVLADPHYGLINELFDKVPFIHGAVVNIYSVPGILWVHLSLTTIPIATLLLAPALRQLDSAYEEASELSGASRITTLRRIVLPLVFPAVLTAFVAGLIFSLQVFEVEQILGVPEGISVYSTRIYNLIGTTPPDYAQAMALSTLFLLVLFCVAVVYRLLIARVGQSPTITARSVRFTPHRREWWAYPVAVILYLGVAIALALPTVVLVIGSFMKLFGVFSIKEPWTWHNWSSVLSSPQFGSALRSSLEVGLAVGILGTLVFTLLGWLLARRRVWTWRPISGFVWLPWAVPGLLLGTAYLNVFLRTPIASGLLQTKWALIIALLVQSLPLGTYLLRGSSNQVSLELEEASYVAGASVLRTLARITVRLVMPMMITVFLILFMSALRDISTTVMLASPGTQTLPLLMFGYTLGDQVEAASVVGVITAVLAMVIAVLVLKLGAWLEGERT